MKFWKLFMPILTAAILALGLAGCGDYGKKAGSETPVTEKPSSEHPSGEHPK